MVMGLIAGAKLLKNRDHDKHAMDELRKMAINGYSAVYQWCF